jgi:hypothetical protein
MALAPRRRQQKSRIVLEHAGLDDSAVASHTNGWTGILAALERYPAESAG